jgi:hypothetical protein
MSKTFLVVPGYEARNGHVRYGPGVTMYVEEDEQVEVYLLRQGRHCNVRQYEYSKLDPQAPPPGLRSA